MTPTDAARAEGIRLGREEAANVCEARAAALRRSSFTMTSAQDREDALGTACESDWCASAIRTLPPPAVEASAVEEARRAFYEAARAACWRVAKGRRIGWANAKAIDALAALLAAEKAEVEAGGGQRGEA